MESEKFFVSNNKSKATSYGSLRKEPLNLVVNFKHKLKNDETLQGISLKYGVSIESIKRANKLWTNDLAFIRDYLVIPLPKERSHEFGHEENGYHEKVIEEDSSINVTEDNKTYIDYLSKFDSLINQSKEKLKSMESSKSYNENSSEEINLFQTNSTQYKSPASSHSIKSNESRTSTERMRQAQEQLQKLELEKDDLYEL